MNIGKMLLDLHECLCTAIAEKAAADSDYGEPCSCTVMWSDVITLDHCGLGVECGSGKCGQAWVRFIGVTPDESVDVSAIKCVAAFQIEMEAGIGRCSAIARADSDVDLPTEDDFMSDTIVGAEDMDVLTKAVLCCRGKNKNEQIIISSIAPFGPEGGCFGTVATLTAKVIV